MVVEDTSHANEYFKEYVESADQLMRYVNAAFQQPSLLLPM